MPRSEARVKVSIWANPDWRELSHEAQWLYLTLLSQPDINLCGVLPYMPERWRRLCGDQVDVETALHDLETEGFVEYDLDTFEVLVRTFVTHDGVLRSPNTRQAMWKCFDAIMSNDLASTVLDTLPASAISEASERLWSQRLSDCFQGELVTDLDVSESLSRTRDNTDSDSDSNSNMPPLQAVDNSGGRSHWRTAAAIHLGASS